MAAEAAGAACEQQHASGGRIRWRRQRQRQQRQRQLVSSSMHARIGGEKGGRGGKKEEKGGGEGDAACATSAHAVMT